MIKKKRKGTVFCIEKSALELPLVVTCQGEDTEKQLTTLVAETGV